MNVKVTVELPRFIYDIYADAARELDKYTVEQVMSGALQAYAQLIFNDLKEKGELT